MKAYVPKILLRGVLLFLMTGATEAHAAHCWGRLANPGFDGERIKTTLFFAGQAFDGSTITYTVSGGSINQGCVVGSFTHLYTLNPEPRDPHLIWTNAANREFVLDLITRAGINVISMSSWGEDFLPCTDGWSYKAAPMQTSPTAHDELFMVAANRRLRITPFIESRGPADTETWKLRNEFPRATDGRVAPGLVSQIVNLIQRYLQNPAHPEWSNVWTKVYDRNGTPRHAVVLIHAVSDRLSPLDATAHQSFAAGFDLVANEVAQATGVQVGFFLDALPSGASVEASFNPSADDTGPYLRNTSSILGIQCFIPEVFLPFVPFVGEGVNNSIKLTWKRAFIRGWFSTGIPVLVDAAPGYDGHIVFPSSTRAGFSDEWLQLTGDLVDDYGRAGMVYNSWNGYTEAMVGTPTSENGNRYYDWLTGLNSNQAVHVDRNFATTGWGTVSEPFQTVAMASTEACERDVIQIRSGTYPEAITILKPLTLQAEGGPVTIGN